MWADVFGMFSRRMIPVAVAVLGLAFIGGNADPKLTAAPRVTLSAAIDDSSTTVGLADSNLARLTTEGEIDKQLDMMQSIGVKNVRIGLSWFTIERQQGVYDFTATDYVVQQAYKRGMGVLAVLHETPRWAGNPVLSGQPDPVAFGKFAGEVAAHYAGKISAVEVWNEPNAKFFLNPVDPAGYTALLKAAYTAIKNVTQVTGDDITVIGGVLGSGRTLDGNDGTVQTMNPVEFLAGMYAAGAHGYFDALSFHPYKYDMKFSEQAEQIASPLQQLWRMRDLMKAFGDEGLKIWASEYGLPTDPYNPNFPNQYISPEQQAAYIKDFLNSWSQQDGTGPMFIYSTRDLNTGTSSDGDNFGIWETDWTAKPAVDVIREFIADQNGRPIIDFIRNAIVNLAKFAGAVVKGAVDVAVGVVTALVDATVWVVKSVAKVAGAVVQGIVDVTKRIATAICNTVHAVVDRVQDAFDRNDSAPAGTALTAARTLSTAKLADTADEVTKDAETGTASVHSNKSGHDAKTPTEVVPESTTETTTVKKLTQPTDVSAKETEEASGTEKTGTTTAATATPTKSEDPKKDEDLKKDLEKDLGKDLKKDTAPTPKTDTGKTDTTAGGSTTSGAGNPGPDSSVGAGAKTGSAGPTAGE